MVLHNSKKQTGDLLDFDDPYEGFAMFPNIGIDDAGVKKRHGTPVLVALQRCRKLNHEVKIRHFCITLLVDTVLDHKNALRDLKKSPRSVPKPSPLRLLKGPLINRCSTASGACGAVPRRFFSSPTRPSRPEGLKARMLRPLRVIFGQMLV